MTSGCDIKNNDSTNAVSSSDDTVLSVENLKNGLKSITFTQCLVTQDSNQLIKSVKITYNFYDGNASRKTTFFRNNECNEVDSRGVVVITDEFEITISSNNLIEGISTFKLDLKAIFSYFSKSALDNIWINYLTTDNGFCTNKIDPYQLYENFSFFNRNCFGIQWGQKNEMTYELLGAAVEKESGNNYKIIFIGDNENGKYNGKSPDMRPKKLNLEFPFIDSVYF
jgi:hypothetical protein